TVVHQALLNQRLIPNAIEPRACIASVSPATGELTLWVTSQNPHVHRLLMAAFVLSIPETKMRVIAPDVGGGFGSKIFVYNEEVVVSWAAKRLGRPVKWTAERRESFLNDAHGRDHVTEAEIALDHDGKVSGLRVKTPATRRAGAGSRGWDRTRGARSSSRFARRGDTSASASARASRHAVRRRRPSRARSARARASGSPARCASIRRAR